MLCAEPSLPAILSTFFSGLGVWRSCSSENELAIDISEFLSMSASQLSFTLIVLFGLEGLSIGGGPGRVKLVRVRDRLFLRDWEGLRRSDVDLKIVVSWLECVEAGCESLWCPATSFKTLVFELLEYVRFGYLGSDVTRYPGGAT